VRFCESVEVKSLRATRPCAESFFHTLKVELVHGESFATRETMRRAVSEYIEVDYNLTRRLKRLELPLRWADSQQSHHLQKVVEHLIEAGRELEHPRSEKL